MTHYNYFVISPTYNAQDYILKCMQSVKDQVVPANATIYHIVVNDGSTDKTKEIINAFVNPNLTKVHQETRKGTMNSHLEGIANTYFADSYHYNIIVHLDGDDWFNTNQAICKIHEQYLKPNCWATYGNYTTTDGSPSVCKPYTSDNFRVSIINGWCFSHVRTFRRNIFAKVKARDLKDEQGIPYSSAQDVAIFLPILELAGLDRIKFIDEPLAVYNVDNPLNDSKIRLNDQVRCALDIYKRKKYDKL